MEIKSFISKVKDFRDLNNSIQIPYFVYYLQQIEENGGITQSDIIAKDVSISPCLA